MYFQESNLWELRVHTNRESRAICILHFQVRLFTWWHLLCTPKNIFVSLWLYSTGTSHLYNTSGELDSKSERTRNIREMNNLFYNEKTQSTSWLWLSTCFSLWNYKHINQIIPKRKHVKRVCIHIFTIVISSTWLSASHIFNSITRFRFFFHYLYKNLK